MQLLVAVTSAYRYDGSEVDEAVAHAEAITLHDEIQRNPLKHEEIIRVL